MLRPLRPVPVRVVSLLFKRPHCGGTTRVTEEDLHGLIAAIVCVAALCIALTAALIWWAPCLENCEGSVHFIRRPQLIAALVALVPAGAYVGAALSRHRSCVPLLVATVIAYVVWIV